MSMRTASLNRITASVTSAIKLIASVSGVRSTTPIASVSIPAPTNTIGIVSGQCSIRIDTAANATISKPIAATSMGCTDQPPVSRAIRFFVAAQPQIGQVERSCRRAGQYSRPK